MSQIIALFNQAGGVAKSTITQNLGYHLSMREGLCSSSYGEPCKLRQYRVLLVDLDPQASLTSFMGIEPSELETTIYDALVPKNEDEELLPIQQNIHGMDLIPSNIELANAEQELIFAELRELRLSQVLEPVRDNYDFILIDCPPSLGILSHISLVAANYVLVPIQCQFKALKGTDSLLKTVARVRKRLNPQLKIAGFIPTMYQASTSLDNRTLESIQNQLGEIATIFPPLPRATAVAEASESGKPLALCSNKHKPTLQLFDQLALAMEKI
jgi:chromosome partitioning protein